MTSTVGISVQKDIDPYQLGNQLGNSMMPTLFFLKVTFFYERIVFHGFSSPSSPPQVSVPKIFFSYLTH